MRGFAAGRRAPVARLVAGSAAVLVAIGFAPSTLAAQDFLLSTPRVSLSLHGGFNAARAGSQAFDFATEFFTVEKQDFNSPTVRTELAVRLTERFDVSVDVSWMSSDILSEDREFIGADDLPIVQATEFSQTPISFNVKYYLKDRGRSIGSLAWIPEKFVPYLGTGIGIAKYSFSQSGEFVVCVLDDGFSPPVDQCLNDAGQIVDGATLDIVNDRFESSTEGRLFHILGGVEYALSNHALVVLDGRYRWASAKMRNDWVAFDDIDLSGLSVSLGLAVRF
ncbi:MAG TPA: hypothetical protein VJ925_14720 [Longimicrobiales bacterium]|nr:hypothetical protein [Longimicrobiales bacterium]